MDFKAGGQSMKFTFLLPNVEISGGNRANFELSNALIELGHEVVIFYPLVPGRDGLGWTSMRKTLVQLLKGVTNIFCRGLWFDLKAELKPLTYFSHKQLGNALPKADYLIVSWWAHVPLISDLGSGFGEQVHLIRSLEFWGGPEQKVTQAYQQSLVKIVTSYSLQTQYEQKFGEVDGIVSDGVCLDTFSPGTSQYSKDDFVTIGMMYRRQPLKRMADGLQVLSVVAGRHPNLRVMLFGERLKNEDKARLAFIPNWEYTNFPIGHHLRDLYRCLDIFLFTSGPEEAFGLPPLEAMACGCAVVSTDVGAVREYATMGETALICEPGDLEGLAEQLEKLIVDRELLKNIGTKGAESVRSLSWHNSALKLQQILADHES
ncbi:MAG: glycosyltransferase involved in cell wall biosynthesis [Candidatus Azotimanducaceae bacterium]